MWTKERIIALNKLICEASNQPRALRDEVCLDDLVNPYELSLVSANYLYKGIAERHPFVEGNKRTAVCIAICETLKNI